ncbi:hypothetical protein IJ556_06390, partial [bacterium]|nr:hypothetical protein [bacterium]
MNSNNSQKGTSIRLFVICLMLSFFGNSSFCFAANNGQCIKFTETKGKIAYIDLTLVGDWTADDVKALEFRMKEGGSATWKHLKNNYPEVSTANSGNGKKKIVSNYGKTGSSKVDLRFKIHKNSILDSACIRIAPTAELLEKLGSDKYIQIGISGQAGAHVVVEGNIMAGLYAHNCTTSTALRPRYFYRFFTAETATGTAELNANNFTVDCSALRLPTTTLQEGCYEEMFAELGSHLTAAP